MSSKNTPHIAGLIGAPGWSTATDTVAARAPMKPSDEAAKTERKRSLVFMNRQGGDVKREDGEATAEPLCHFERSEESTGVQVGLQACEYRDGFFASLRVTSQ